MSRLFIPICFLFVLLNVSMSIQAQDKTIEKFSETLYIKNTGDAGIFWDLQIGSLADSVLVLPMPYKNIKDLTSDRPEFHTVLTKKDGISRLAITLPPDTNEKNIRISFISEKYYSIDSQEVKDFGNLSYAYKFINNSCLRIHAYKSTIYLPPGYVVTSVDESIPKISQNSPDLPYEVVYKDSLHGVEIRGKDMKIGDRVSINIRLKKEGKSIIFLIAIAFFGLFYMIYFRELYIKKPAALNSDRSQGRA